MAPAHQPITSREGFEEALNSNSGKNVLIYYYKDDIPAEAEQMSRHFSNTTVSYKADVTANAAAAKTNNISKTPTILLYRDGKELHRVEEPDTVNMGPVVSTMSA